jgi:hypothetical protein
MRAKPQGIVSRCLASIMAQRSSAVPNPTTTKLNRAVDELATLRGAFDVYCHENSQKIADIQKKYDEDKNLILLMYKRTQAENTDLKERVKVLEAELNITVIDESGEAGDGCMDVDGSNEAVEGFEGLTEEMLQRKEALEKCEEARMSQEVKVNSISIFLHLPMN